MQQRMTMMANNSENTFFSFSLDERISALLKKGVIIHRPETVFIASDVDFTRIHPGAVIHPGCRIHGKDALILPGAEIGQEAPATVENCCVGPEASLKGGYFKKAVFLKGASMGSCAHVREGTLLEDMASGAHAVGLKQTILFPFATLGSLINFCDCLLAGGTSRKNHSEVGSSYIHFNYTPNQDKATPSLLGDVPKGVMLNQRPIFLGGQGGLVGPRQLAFGTVVAAGTICRKDELREDRLLFGGGMKAGNMPFTPGGFTGAGPIIKSNIIYIGNLMALRRWYDHVRSMFIGKDFPEPLWVGAKSILNAAIAERMKRLEAFVVQHEAEAAKKWLDMAASLESAGDFEGDARMQDAFLRALEDKVSEVGKDYIGVIQGLAAGDSERGVEWLQGIVDDVMVATSPLV